jgi:hypothetical protein
MAQDHHSPTYISHVLLKGIDEEAAHKSGEVRSGMRRQWSGSIQLEKRKSPGFTGDSAPCFALTWSCL